MQIKVDPDKCQGHNRCVALAGELFELDEIGMSQARGNGEVPAGLEDKARLAVDNCPEFAIEIQN